MPSLFEKDISTLKGVGLKRAALFQKLGVPTVGDLLHLYPRAYEDWRDTVPIRSTLLNEVNIVKGTVLRRPTEQRIRGGMTLYKTTITDGEDDLHITFFNNKYVMNMLEEGAVYAFRGKVTGTFTRREMTSPEFVPESRMQDMVPVYPQTEGLTSRMIANAVKEAIKLLPEVVNDPIPDELRMEYALCRLEYALKTIHFPGSPEELSTARRRLVFEELLVLQLGMMELRRAGARENPYPIKSDRTADFSKLLPFTMTGAQQRAIRDAMRDMQGAHPMNRLIQGDVGSGKTAVAAALCYNVIQNGLQAALMAPTEILATQHFESLSALLEPTGIRVALITGSTKAKERREILSGLLDGSVQLAVGTHALISEGVEFQSLALVITDEQHRFGVGQRTALAKKGNFPHTLVMSATPIPRTLALMIYGDLDVSVLDELPPGRQPIESFLIDPAKRRRAFGYIQKHLDEGRQAYVVCPLIEENDSDMASVKAYEETLRGFFKDTPIGVLHGRMKPKEKDAVMSAFSAGQTKILLSTTVVEVGVDVPNAVLMMIENAERYGLSQLHQLRGRV
ncbi:MAG: ATP-dependent DNA helicase RecG, partial [Clostridia bacterium]|nr:ATP-dependent DNA helicase RecG [Clostridia bacterium]